MFCEYVLIDERPVRRFSPIEQGSSQD
jgi:hypothetical protein